MPFELQHRNEAGAGEVDGIVRSSEVEAGRDPIKSDEKALGFDRRGGWTQHEERCVALFVWG